MTIAEFSEDYRDSAKCVICGFKLPSSATYDGEQDAYSTSCSNCGQYRLAGSAFGTLAGGWWPEEAKRQYLPLLAHQVRARQRTEPRPFVGTNWLHRLLDNEPEFPNAIQQIENLVIELAETLRPGEPVDIEPERFQAVAGSSTAAAFTWVVESALEKGLIRGDLLQYVDSEDFALARATLTVDGWTWYKDIGKHKRSRLAFMAMPYGIQELDSMYNDCFKPAVGLTGFTLFRLDDEPKAGIIDNRLRVEIRRSRLVLADITHDNRGAIWEAGFAEGLGIPVIYTCEKSRHSNKHFDIRNCQMVLWESGNLSAAGDLLKATIRNTLPGEAVFEDPGESTAPQPRADLR
jgi:hypothetical protein